MERRVVADATAIVRPPPAPDRFWMTPDLQPFQDKLDAGEPLASDEMIEYCRLRGLEDLFFFGKVCFGFNYLEAPLHLDLAYVWQVPNGTNHAGRIYGNTRAALMARTNLKTTLCTQAYAVWRLMRNPEERGLIYTHSYAFGTKILSLIKARFEGHGPHGQWFLALYGDRMPAKSERQRWTENMLTINRQGAYTDASLEATGVGGSITGGHFTFQCIDDLQAKQEPPQQIAKIKDAYDNLTPMLLAGGDRRIVATHWGFNDVMHHIKRMHPRCIVAQRRWKEDGHLVYSRTDEADVLALFRSNPFLASCNPAGTPILMADWSERNIEDVKAGDVVMGFALTGRRRLVPSVVQRIGTRTSTLVKVETDAGATFYCTPDHHWFNARFKAGSNTAAPYRPAKVGNLLARVAHPLREALTPEQERAAAWLGGIFDGEGCAKGQNLTFAQSLAHNPEVHEAIGSALRLLGFDYGLGSSGPRGGYYALRGGREAFRRFLALCQPVKGFTIRRLMDTRRGNVALGHEKVTRVTPVDMPATVYSMQTETGNYVAHGLASRNCWYDNNPRDDTRDGFRRAWFKGFEQQGNTLRELDADGKVTREIRTEQCHCFFFVDPNTGRTDASALHKRGHDYLGLIVLLVGPDNTWYVPRVIRARWSVEQFVDETYTLADYYQPKFIALEQRAAQILFRHIFQTEGKRRNKFLTLIDWKGGSASKEERIKSLLPRYANGMIYHRANAPAAVQEGIAALEQELLDFPTAEYDDVSDALSAAGPLAYAPGAAPRHEVRALGAKEATRLMLDRGSRRAWNAVDRAARQPGTEFYH